MRTLMLAALPFLSAAAVAAPAQSETQPRTQRTPVSCIYYGTLRGMDRAQVIALVQKGMTPANNEERMIIQKVGEAAAACRARYGWGEPRRQAAIQYFNARNIYDGAKPKLDEYGIAWPMVEAYVATLDDATKQAYRSGQVTGAMISAAIEHFKAAGATKLGELTQDNAQPVGQAVATGVASAVVQKDAEAAYIAR